ncbi:MAG: 2-amino-4-hydroxy-6-hydroxymethyldihydropteridine diphosphokinase [Cyanobium sp.]
MQQIDSGSGRALQPEPEDQRHQASPVLGAAAVAVALGANLGDPLATLLAVRPLLAAELRGWWRELGRPRGLGEGRDRGAGDGGAADGDRNGEGAGGWARDGAWNRDGAKGSAAARLRWSPLFRTAPVGGPAGQPDYLNAVVVIDGGPPPADADRPGLAGTPPGSGLSAAAKAIAPAGATVEPDAGAALALLRRLQRLEQRFGRVRAEPWGPRSLDLDLLWCGPLHLERPELQLPHPRLRERAFVLTPLAAIDPELVVPGAGIWPPPADEGTLDEAAAAEHPAATAGMLLAALPAAALEPPPQRRLGRRGWPE